MSWTDYVNWDTEKPPYFIQKYRFFVPTRTST